MEPTASLFTAGQSSSTTFRIWFFRLPWSVLVAALLLLFLSYYNYPFTSSYGATFIWQVFWDPALPTRLEIDRNLMELGLPLHIYNFIGILPGYCGFALLAYCVYLLPPHVLHFSEKEVVFWEWKFLFPIPTTMQADRWHVLNIQSGLIGRKIIPSLFWIIFIFLGFWGIGSFWAFAFDSIKNNGSWYFFSVIQTIWNGTEPISSMNVGEHLFVTAVIMVGAPLLMILFPRREFGIENQEIRITTEFSAIRFQFPWKTLQISTLEEFLKDKPAIAMILNYISNSRLYRKHTFDDSSKSSSESTEFLSHYYPKFKGLCLLIAWIFVILITFLPRFFIGDFFFPFVLISSVQLLVYTTRVIHNAWWTEQIVTKSEHGTMLQRFNPAQGWMVVFTRSTDVNKIHSQQILRPEGIEFFTGTLWVWEIFMALTVMAWYPGHFITNPWTILRLIILIGFLALVGIMNFDRIPIHLLQTSPEEIKNVPVDFFIIVPQRNNSIKEEARSWWQNFRSIRSQSNWVKIYFPAYSLYVFAFICYILWWIFFALNTQRFWVYLFI
jgi:hypothetical protein